jgi:hypothetical protein
MIQIKRNNKVFFTLEDFGEGSKLSYQLMDHHYIILKFTTATPIYFEIGDSVEIPDFGYFELTSSYFPKHNDSDGYDYEMQMDAYYMSWKNKLCKYRPQHGANETSFSLTTTVGVHMNVILGNLKALGLTYNGKEFSVDYTTYNNKAFDVQKRFLIEYGSISILDALNAICSEDALNCEWWIDGSIIYLGYCEMEGQTTFEQDVNVLSMSYSESKSTYITRLYAFGSDRNIPKGYFTGADADVTTDGVATDYLMLPNKEVDSDGFYAKDGYLENVNVVKNDKQAIEGVVMFDEEYPKVECRVSSIKTYDSTVDNEDGTKTTQTFWQVTSTDSFTNNFKESWIKSNLTLGIKFTSGALMGMEFDVSFKVIDKVNYFEIVANDTYGRTLPDGVMCPKVGDKYFLFNWDATKITDTDLIPTAQLSLFDRAKQYYQKTMISNSNFTCTMDGDKFYNDGTYDYHPLGEQVKLINDMFAQVDADGKHYRNSRIIGMEIPLDIPYDHPQYTVGEKAATSRLGKLEDKVDSIKVNGMQIGGTGSGNGGVYVIGLNDSTPASDSNVYSARRSRMEFISRLQDNSAKGTITWEKIQKLLSGLLVGNPNNENGGSWTPDAEGRSHLITDYLEVRMKAIFEELVINKTSTIGGKEIISPAGGVVAHKVEEVTVTYNNVSQKAYRCYFLAEQDGDEVDNDFAVNDQVRSESFNVRKGTYHKAGNHFYWRLVIGRDEDPVELEGKKYHYIDLSDTDCATASDVPAKGDVLNQCGNRTDVERQNCLIFSAVDTYSPSISLYHGINSYSFANREYVEYGVNKQTNKAFFHVYGDMYVGDRPTKENGYEGSSYIRYDSSTKQVSVKGKISAKSTVDGKELSQYIKENTDDTVANAAKKAAEDAQKAAQNAQTDITNLGKTVTGNKKEFDNYVTNGYLEPSEIAAMAQDSKRLEDDFAAAQKSYNEVKEAEVLANTNELIDLKTAFDTLTTAKTELVTYLSDISARYNAANTEKKATIVSAVGTKFTNFQSAYSAFYDKLGLANAYITSKIYSDLGVVIGDVTSLAYLKKALMDAPDTEINGGLVLTSLIGLRDTDGNTTAGINGITEKSAKGGGVAAWFGGEMVDKDYNDGSKTPANTIFRFDGSGYVAGGAIWWETDGRVHADPTSFIISEKNLGAYLTFFEPTWKAGSAGTSVADLVSLKPNAPFSKLGVSGDATFEGAITFHGIKITYDATNKAIKVDGNLYATGGITAYGAGASTTGGGGLKGSVKSYADSLNLTSESLSEIASAYSIKQLSTRITSLEGGSATSISVSGSGNAVTSVTKNGTVISIVKGATFLTSHQSLAGYATQDWVNAKGYITSSGGSSFIRRNAFPTPANNTVKAYKDSLVKFFENYPNGIGANVGVSASIISNWSNDAATYFDSTSYSVIKISGSYDGVTYGQFLLSSYDLSKVGIVGRNSSKWSKIKWLAYEDQIPTDNNQLANGAGYITSSGSCAYATSAGNAETVDGYYATMGNNKPWGTIPVITAAGGYMDIGKHLEFHYDNSTGSDYSTALMCTGNHSNVVNLPSGSGTLALTTDNVYSATKLQTARSLWGNSFNGTSDINGSIIVPSGKYISIGNIKMEYDATNKALKITNTTTSEVANLYTSGGVSAYGVGTSSSGGGGLNGSVKSYSNALKLTSESLSEIASAYSIKALDSRISSLEGGSATAISVSGSGNAVTSVTKNGTTISVVKGSTFLTSHQSLDGYVNAISVSGSGNAITSVSKSGKGITFTKGATFLTSHQSLANYYTKSSVDSLLSGKSATSHTHSVKINGVTKTIAATGGTAVDLGTYLTSHQSLNGYATQSWVKSQGYLTTHQDVSILNMANNRYYINNAYGINMRNSDIIGVNSVYTQDLSDSPIEAILFCRSNGNYDGIRAANGVLYFSNNVVRTTSKYDAEYEVYHKGNLTKLSQLTNDKNFVTGSVSGQTININGVSTTWQNTWRGITDSYSGTSTGTSLSQKGANSLYNALHNGYASSAGNADTLDGYHANGSNVAPYGHIPTIESDGVMEVGKYIDFHNDNSGKHDFSTRLLTTGNYGNSVNLPSDSGTLALISNNVASATKLQTPRTIWGQSFDGTGNVNGTIYINNGDSENGAIILNNNVNANARISAIKDQVVFNTGAAIRFGAVNWEYSDWAGLKYDTVANAIYLGIADGTVFNYHSNKRSNGTLKFPGITTITPDSGARIGNAGGDLFLGNSNNSGWVKVQDMCSQESSNNWRIDQGGGAIFKGLNVNNSISCGNITINSDARINGNLSVNGLINNKGILPTNYEVNNKGTNCYVSADALCSGITAITDSIQVNQVTVQYSNDSGNSWTNYSMNNDAKFNLYASNAGLTQVYLGYNVITGNNDAEKLAQVKKNELIVSFYISASCYTQAYFASVDISKGIDTICTVEILNNSGAVVETFTKHMKGWNQVNYINLSKGNTGYGLGTNDRRYIRFKFKHDQNTTELRNASINKIRIFSFTKYSFPTDRFMGHTGHIYNFDYNMNTYFPNSILAKGGVTAYQSSDIRLKQDLRKLDYLGIIKAMGGTFGFAWKKDNTRSIGWIAQHVLCNPHLNDIVETDEKGYYKINYWSPKLIATAFGAIEQVGDEVSRLKARVVFLESEVQRLSGDKEDCNKKRLDNKNINSLN